MLKNVLYLTAKLAALLAVSINTLASANAQRGFFPLDVLAFSCLFVLHLLVTRLKPSKTSAAIFTSIGIVACLAYDAEMYYPVLLLLIFELIDALSGDGYFYQLAATATLLSFFIFSPEITTLTIFGSVCVLFIFARFIAERLEKARKALLEERKRTADALEKISRLEQYSRTIRETAAIEERSRFSARIHDKLGHSISGNIILLEGARLNVRKNPEKAEECIDIATDSLRNGVDEIRSALKEEPSKRTCYWLSDAQRSPESLFNRVRHKDVVYR